MPNFVNPNKVTFSQLSAAYGNKRAIGGRIEAGGVRISEHGGNAARLKGTHQQAVAKSLIFSAIEKEYGTEVAARIFTTHSGGLDLFSSNVHADSALFNYLKDELKDVPRLTPGCGNPGSTPGGPTPRQDRTPRPPGTSGGYDSQRMPGGYEPQRTCGGPEPQQTTMMITGMDDEDDDENDGDEGQEYNVTTRGDRNHQDYVAQQQKEFFAKPPVPLGQPAPIDPGPHQPGNIQPKPYQNRVQRPGNNNSDSRLGQLNKRRQEIQDKTDQVLKGGQDIRDKLDDNRARQLDRQRELKRKQAQRRKPNQSNSTGVNKNQKAVRKKLKREIRQHNTTFANRYLPRIKKNGLWRAMIEQSRAPDNKDRLGGGLFKSRGSNTGITLDMAERTVRNALIHHPKPLVENDLTSSAIYDIAANAMRDLVRFPEVPLK